MSARWGAGAALVLLAIVLFFVFIFQWNWLRGPLAQVIAGRLHRQVAINGDLHVRPWSLSPSATVEGLVIGNPDWAGGGAMATLPRVNVSVRLPELLRGQVILPLVEANHPDVRLVRDKTGRANWAFNDARAPQPLRLPPIRHFVIDDGHLRIDDAQRRMVFVGVVSSNERATGSGRGAFSLVGSGTLNGAAFQASVTGGPLLNVDPNRPYPFAADVHAGATHVTARGTIPHPFDLARFDAQMGLTGPDLADLYRLTGLALPATPPYSLSGAFTRDGDSAGFKRFSGRVGDSDLAGSLNVKTTAGRPFLTADLVSRRLRLVDLAAVIGGAPKHTAGHTVSPAQVATSARLRAEHRVLPDAHLELTRVRAMDARVSYRADSVEDRTWPVRKVSLKVSLDHGVIVADPLAMTLTQGQLSGHLRVDARRALPAEDIDLRLAGAKLESLIGKGGANPPLEGTLLARARLSGVGDSVRSAAGSSNGVVTLVIPHGQMRQTLAELLGINATKGLFLYLSGSNAQTPVRCGVANFRAQNGVLTADQIVLDTAVVQSHGRGQIDMRNETLNLKFDGKTKKFRLVHVAAPITLTGRFEHPKVGVDVGKAAGQLTLGGLLGVFVSPLAAVLPFVDPGLAHDADCSSLIAEAAGHGAPVAPPRAAAHR